MPPEPHELVASPPVQLTFDRFITGPENQFAANAPKLMAGPGRPRYNPLVNPKASRARASPSFWKPCAPNACA